MKQFFKFFFASLLALMVGGALLLIIFFSILGAIGSSFSESIKGDDKVSVKDKSILVLPLNNTYPELRQNNIFAMFTGGPFSTPGLRDVLTAIEYAKEDKKIKGIYLKANGSSNGLATSEQLRSALKDFKQSGKFIYAYGDFISQSDYYLASVADSIFVNPIGGVELKGLSSQIAFLKGALDKLDVEPEIFYCGQFKSATEPFRMDKMSEPNRKQIAALHESVWSNYLTAFSEFVKTDTATINSWTQQGLIQNASDALKYKMVSGLKYKDQLESLLKEKTEMKEDEDLRLVSIGDYISTVPMSTNKDQIAILVGEGEIVDGQASTYSDPQIASETFVKQIRKVKENDNIKAVVLRVNSPGGSALASEIILREIQLLKEKKPVVVSMGDLAASGGYYISCQADSIFALPTTITGSIGVFGMMFNTAKFFKNKLGVTFDEQKNAPYADFPNLNREMTAQEKIFIQNGVDSVYHTFKSRVAAGRKMNIEYVDSVGQGRVWTGEIGLQLGLVDALGGLDRAIQSAANLAKIEKYRVVTYPQDDGKMTEIMKSLGKAQIQEMYSAQQILEKELGINFRWMTTIKKMQENKTHIWMTMPYIPEIK